MSIFDDDDIDDVDALTDEDRDALAAEKAGISYEPEPQPSREVVAEKEDLSRKLAEERERFARADERRIAAGEARDPRQPQQPQGPPSRLGSRPDDYLDPIGADIWDVRRENELLVQRFEAQQRTAEQNESSARSRMAPTNSAWHTRIIKRPSGTAGDADGESLSAGTGTEG
jgi:hypothetical protein